MELQDFDNLPVMMHCIDKNGRIIYVNKQWLGTTGFDREEVLQRESIEFLSPESKEFARTLVLPLFFNQRRIKSIPLEMVRKDGAKLQVLMSATSFLDDQGEFKHSIACSTDVSSLVKNPFVGTGNEADDYWLVNQQSFHTRLIQIRKLIGQTQADVAKVLGVSSRTYQRLESGDTQLTADQMLKMCHEYDLAPTLFFTSRVTNFAKRAVNILIVDDDKDIVELAALSLGDGFKIRLATSGQEALNYLKEEVFDVLITDFKMPGMTGVQLVEKLRKMELRNYPEIFLMSGFATPDLSENVGIDRDHLLNKPIDYDVLRAKILRKYIS